MQKKKFDLTSELVIIDPKNLRVNEQINKSSKLSGNSKKVLITVAIDENLRAEFKAWCAKHRLKMTTAFVKGFNLMKEKYDTE